MSDEEQRAPRVVPIASKRKGYPYPASDDRTIARCSHYAVTASERDRTLTCNGCGAAVDPLDWIVQLSRRWRREWGEVNRLRRMNHDLAHAHGAGAEIRIRAARVEVLVAKKVIATSRSTFGGSIGRLEDALSAALWKLRAKRRSE